MKKVMVIGAGRGQIPIMNLCHKYGWFVIAVSPKGNYPGLKVADEVFYEDVRHHDIILDYAISQNIDAVLTDQLDEGVSTSAYIAEKMGLNGITCEIADKFTNKFIMRKEAAKAGIYIPKCITAFDMEEVKKEIKNLNFPLMIKPVDSAASKGVYKVNNLWELEKKFEESKSYSKTAAVIIEEFINGKEYVVEAFTSNYNVTNLCIGHRDYFDIRDTFIPNATVFVDAESADSHVENMIKETNEKIVKEFGLKFGITHGEYLYDKNTDRVYLVEIAARGGGVFISSDLIPTSCGVNANELLVKEVLGIPNDNAIKIASGASAYFCYLTPEGIVNKIEGADEIEEIEGVYKAFFDNISIGMKTMSIKDKSSRKGPILVHGKNKKDCYNIIEKVMKNLHITVKTKDGEESIIWR